MAIKLVKNYILKQNYVCSQCSLYRYLLKIAILLILLNISKIVSKDRYQRSLDFLENSISFNKKYNKC